MKKKRYAFISMLVPDETKTEVATLSKGNMQDAANALEWHIYNGLSKNLGQEIKLLNILPIASFPQYYKKVFIPKKNFKTAYSGENENLAFCNLKFLRRYSQAYSVEKAVERWIADNKEQKIIFVYTASPVFLKPLGKIKKKYPDIKICVIIADLPGMTSLSSKKSIFIKLYEHISKKDDYLEYADYFVLLTKHMARYLHLNKPYCVMEGIATEPELFGLSESSDGKKKVVYAGTLHRRFGVLNLLKAFNGIDGEDYRLQICGVGDCEEIIREATQKDTRIEFFGQLPREQVLQMQKNATVLINPRQNIEEFTKYSFPSKNLEYLSSGIPCIAYKLDGIPDEYDEYFYYVPDNTIEALRNKIVEVCEMDTKELKERSIKAQKFVLLQKNETVQTRKIIAMLQQDEG